MGAPWAVKTQGGKAGELGENLSTHHICAWGASLCFRALGFLRGAGWPLAPPEERWEIKQDLARRGACLHPSPAGRRAGCFSTQAKGGHPGPPPAVPILTGQGVCEARGMCPSGAHVRLLDRSLGTWLNSPEWLPGLQKRVRHGHLWERGAWMELRCAGWVHARCVGWS